MPIVAPTGQYPETIRGYGHAPGVRGGFVGTAAKIAARYFGRGAGRLGSRILKPKRYTYRGAVARGGAAGTIIAPFLSTEVDPLDGTYVPPVRQTPNRFQQRNRRFSRASSGGRCNHGYRHCNICQ